MLYKAIVSLIIFFIFGRSIYGQSTEARVYLPFDLSKPAYFPGGILEENRYFKQQVPYPEKPGKITGNRLIVAFVIEKDGSVEKKRAYKKRLRAKSPKPLEELRG